MQRGAIPFGDRPPITPIGEYSVSQAWFLLKSLRTRCGRSSTVGDEGVAWYNTLSPARHVRLLCLLRHAIRHPPTRYKYKLAFIVVVDKEGHSQIAMQGLLSNEQHETFVFLFEAFKQLIFGRSPQVSGSKHSNAGGTHLSDEHARSHNWEIKLMVELNTTSSCIHELFPVHV